MTAPALFSSADLSVDGRYRYRLTRTWSLDQLAARLTFVMLNPSTADANVDDPTIRRCIGFAKRAGYAGLIVVNLYALRATKPAALWAADDPIGPDNGAFLHEAVAVAGRAGRPVVAAWGVNARRLDVVAFCELAVRYNTRLTCLGVTKDRHPRHPLYIRGDFPFTPWSPTRVLAQAS